MQGKHFVSRYLQNLGRQQQEQKLTFDKSNTKSIIYKIYDTLKINNICDDNLNSLLQDIYGEVCEPIDETHTMPEQDEYLTMIHKINK